MTDSYTARGRWVANPKRKRGRQTIASFTLRVSMGCLISDREKNIRGRYGARQDEIERFGNNHG
jgi:hypothetical protein